MKFFFVFVLLCLAFIGCGNERKEEFTPDQVRIFSYIPRDVQFVLYTNLSELRKTGHWEELIKPSLRQGQANDWLSEFEAETGAGFNKGVADVFTASTWDGNNIIAINFDSNLAEIMKYFNNKSRFSRSEISGKEIFNVKKKPGSYFYFPDSSTLLVLKNEEYLSRLIKGNQESLRDNSKFMKLLKDINLKKHYWMASDQGSLAVSLIEMLTGNSKDMPAGKIIRAIDDVTLAAEFSNDVHVESMLKCKDEKSAYLLSAAIRSALAMDLFSGYGSEIAEIMEKIDMEREGSKLSLEVFLNKEDIRQLKDISKKRLMDKKL